ncbi:T9SS C-terminal target domain-containing protein [bacterium]|nr:MAG: T9SS C-terminal target domain-containing protein [bacterium]
MLKLGLVTDGGSALWTHVKVDLTGTAVDGVVDISSVEVWKDDGDGTWEGTGYDTQIGSGTFSPRTITIDITDHTITTGSQDFFIVYDIAVGADPSHTAGAKLLNNTYITVSGSDEVSSTGFPIESGTSTLPVTLSTFTAQFIENIPTLYWSTQSETDNMGWFVYRNEENDFTTSEKISEFIEGNGTTSQQQSYIYEDSIENPEVGDIYYYWLESIDYSGKVHHYDKVAIMHISEGQDQEPPIAFPLKYGLQYGPNPFSSNLNVSYMLRKSDMVRVEIYNIYGQLLTEFDEGQSTADKMYKLKWNGKDLYGKDVSSGVLLIKLITTEGSETKKAILLRCKKS